MILFIKKIGSDILMPLRGCLQYQYESRLTLNKWTNSIIIDSLPLFNEFDLPEEYFRGWSK